MLKAKNFKGWYLSKTELKINLETENWSDLNFQVKIGKVTGDVRPNNVLYAPIDLTDSMKIYIRNGEDIVDDTSILVSQIIEKIRAYQVVNEQRIEVSFSAPL